MPKPRVTFIIPCFNHGGFVAEAIHSCLAQVDADVNVIVVDDGSTDGSTPATCDAAVAIDPDRITVIHQQNRGLSAARNRGALEARTRGVKWAGPYLAFLDADDFIDPAFVSTLHAAMLEAHPDADTPGAPPDLGDVSHAYCQERLVGLADMTWAVPDWDPLLMMVTNLHPVTALVRRDCFEAVGGFNESMRGGYEDWDLWLKFVERGWRGVRVRKPLFTWRRHSPSTMIVEAGRQHGRLFAQLVQNHPNLYHQHADKLHILANTLLRRGEANWLDESGESIVLRDTRRHAEWLAGERANLESRLRQLDDTLRQERDHAAAAIEHARQRELALLRDLDAARAECDRLRRTYEAKPIVRLSNLVHRALDHTPGPLKRAVRSAVHSVANTAAPAKK